MGLIKNLIYGDPETMGMRYRIRVFDHGHHIKTATVKNRGQRRIDLVVKPKDWGFLGEEIKLAFMVNPAIPPKYFGTIQEVDFDVRDSTQLADLFDICPDLVYELNQNFHDILTELKKQKDKKEGKVADAEFTVKDQDPQKEFADESMIKALTDPIPTKGDPGKEILSPLEEKIQKVPGVMPITRSLDAIVSTGHKFRTELKGVNLLIGINYAEDSEKQKLMQKALDFCMQPGNEKTLRWLPKYLHIEPEIMALVSQTELDGVGIMPMYYIKQSSAEIAEKMLTRPKVPDDWKTTAIWIIGIIAVLGIVIFGLLKLTGRA
jgi:hypothetical protein